MVYGNTAPSYDSFQADNILKDVMSMVFPSKHRKYFITIP